MRTYVIVLAFLAAAATAASAKPAYVASTVNLRASPGTGSEIVTKIPGGSLVDASDCSEGWCAVTWQDKSGYAIQSSLDMSGRIQSQRSVRPRSYDEPIYAERPQIYYEPPPTVYYEPAPYYYGYYGPYFRRGWGRRW